MHYKAYDRTLGWNRLLLPFTFAIAYEAMTWLYWVPSTRAAVLANNGASFVPFWEGLVFGFDAVRILAAFLLFLLFFVLIPRVRLIEAVVLGGLCGVVTSVSDGLLFNRLNLRLGWPIAILGIPLLCGSATIMAERLIVRFMRR